MSQEVKPRVWGNDFELHVNSQSTVDAVIPVSWCLKPELMGQVLRDSDPERYQVLLTCVRDGQEVGRRQIVPLSQMTAYVAFNGSGENTIHALLLEARSSAHNVLGCLRNDYLSRSSNDYYPPFNLFDGNGKRFPPGTRYVSYKEKDDDGRMVASAEITVEVDQKFFAKEPARWLANWANLFFNEKPIDECAFRGRKMFAFTLQPFLVVLGTSWYFLWFLIFRVAVVAPLLLLALRDWNWRALRPDPNFWKPRNWGLPTIWDGAWGLACHGKWDNGDDLKILFNGDRMVTITTQTGDDRKGLWWVLTPLFLLASGGVARFFYWLTGPHEVGSAPFYWWWLVFVIFFASFGEILDYVGKRWEQLPEDEKERRRQEVRVRQEQEKLALKQRQKLEAQQLFSPLACTGRPKTVNFHSVPKANRTLSLRFSHLKSRVCRPFSK